MDKMIKKELNLVAQKVKKTFLESNFTQPTNVDFLQKALLSYPLNTGKCIRSSLCLWFCQAVKGNTQKALKIASAIEMFHNWTLVHDDIIDKDCTRRNKPSCHQQLKNYATKTYKIDQQRASEFGNSMAILVGDLQQAWVYQLIDQSPLSNKLKNCIRQLFINSITNDVLCGEALDIKFEYSHFSTINNKQILKMIELKTARLLEFSCKLGVVIGLQTTNLSHPLILKAGDFAYNLGMAFQLRDDLLDIFSNKKKLGKTIGNDIKRKKITLLYKKALQLTKNKDHNFLLDIFGNEKLSQQQLFKAQAIIKQCGASTFIEQKILTYHKKAVKTLKNFDDKNAVSKLEKLANFIINRNF